MNTYFPKEYEQISGRSYIFYPKQSSSSIFKSKVKLIILAEDLSQNSVEKIKSEADRKGIPVRVYGNKQELSHMTGKENSGIFGITDANLSKAILEEIDHMQSV